jgi:hypothetical protein
MLQLFLRFSHVFFGALWVGLLAFQVFFLAPALSQVGPGAGPVMAALFKRRLPVIMPLFGLITIVSGMWLLQRMSGGNMAGLMATPMGKGFATGGAVALLAFLIGVVVKRPLMMRSVKLGESLPSARPEDRAAMQAELQRVKARGDTLGKVVAWMLLFTLGAMAVARSL